MLFIGAKMKEEWIEQWRAKIVKKSEDVSDDCVKLPCNMSCTQNLGVALGFAVNGLEQPFKSVLFVISIQNHFGFPGFRLNTENFSAYPQEEEVLLIEGCTMFVMKVEDVTLQNNHPDFEHFHGSRL